MLRSCRAWRFPCRFRSARLRVAASSRVHRLPATSGCQRLNRREGRALREKRRYSVVGDVAQVRIWCAVARCRVLGARPFANGGEASGVLQSGVEPVRRGATASRPVRRAAVTSKALPLLPDRR